MSPPSGRKYAVLKMPRSTGSRCGVNETLTCLPAANPTLLDHLSRVPVAYLAVGLEVAGDLAEVRLVQMGSCRPRTRLTWSPL